MARHHPTAWASFPTGLLKMVQVIRIGRLDQLKKSNQKNWHPKDLDEFEGQQNFINRVLTMSPLVHS